jgi:hypothetical protein
MGQSAVVLPEESQRTSVTTPAGSMKVNFNRHMSSLGAGVFYHSVVLNGKPRVSSRHRFALLSLSLVPPFSAPSLIAPSSPAPPYHVLLLFWHYVASPRYAWDRIPISGPESECPALGRTRGPAFSPRLRVLVLVGCDSYSRPLATAVHCRVLGEESVGSSVASGESQDTGPGVLSPAAGLLLLQP